MRIDHSQRKSTPPVPASRNVGWLITFTGSTINVILGSWYAWSVISKAIARDWGWSQAQCNLPFAVATVSFSLTMIFAGRLQDKFGPRLVAICDGTLLGSAMMLSSLSQDPWAITMSYGVLGGLGIGVGYSGTVPSALKWFPPENKGLISGIVVAGVGLAAVFMSPLTHYLLGVFGIPGTFRIMGIGTIATVPLLGMMLRNPPEGYQAAAASRADPAIPATHRDRDWPEMVRTPQFYALWLMYVLSAAPGLMIIANAVQLLSLPEEKIFDPVIAPMIVAAFSTCGRVFGGFISDLIGRRRTLVAVFLLQAANVGGLSLHGTQPALMAGFALAGLLYGSFFALLPAVITDFYGLKNLGVNYGLTATAFGAAGLLGSLLGGYIKDLLRSYDPAYWIFAGMLATAALLASVTRTPDD